MKYVVANEVPALRKWNWNLQMWDQKHPHICIPLHLHTEKVGFVAIFQKKRGGGGGSFEKLWLQGKYLKDVITPRHRLKVLKRTIPIWLPQAEVKLPLETTHMFHHPSQGRISAQGYTVNFQV